MAGAAAQKQEIIHVHDLRTDPKSLVNASSLAKEGFVSYYAAPLITQGQVKGVLEIFHRLLLDPDDEWLSFLETLAGQAAIAIESTTLFEDLQRTNDELSKAYDSTIEGWSHALDLRDKETEGHTQRVTALTVELARTFGLGERELVYIRWGALLHDIGKMGIPDRILLKEGSLTDDEWDVMRQHPTYAHEMLRPIQYLRPTLDIPYCHHEKWDGTGYPRGLKGEEIPLGARIFSVVDVWDALTSDRPYRSAWSPEKTLAHIRDGAGSHFDPQVVDVFIKLINGRSKGE
jgi:putative nucleotidyltransferase with HDIG domain